MNRHPIPVFHLDRPEVGNALDVNTALSLKKQVLQSSQSGVPGFIISSRSQKVFCGGGDLKAYAQMKTKQQGVIANKKIRDALQSLARAHLLVVAAIEGDTIGGGCELALACDWITASRAARFRFAQVNLSLTPGWGGTARLLRRVRHSVALDWLASGRFIEASEALRAGLVDELTPHGDTLLRAESWIREHTPSYSPSLRGIKQAIQQDGAGEEKIFDRLWFNPEHRRRIAPELKPFKK